MPEVNEFENLQAEMTEDIANAWVDTWHYSRKVDGDTTHHLITNNRTIIREYVVEWKNGTPFVTDAPPETTEVGDVTSYADLRIRQFKRKRGMQYNEITHEYRVKL